MLEKFRERLAYRSAVKGAERRAGLPDGHIRSAKRVLVVVPYIEENERAVWHFVEKIKARRDDLILVRTSSLLVDVPARFVGIVEVVTRDDVNWIGLPRSEVAREIWRKKPDVAIDLHFDYDLGAAYIAGASPAACRIGFYHPGCEPFFDLMIRTDARGKQAFDVMEKYLRSFDSPVVPLHP